ncbi:D-alanyl-D-alanine carboxypeptidase [Klebsiella pneumoniae]|nr:D-alanyl-D-alanine carboxypeptidase [Klebsiella pneumoniae]
MRFPRFIIGLTAGIALSAQAANIDEYINQLPAGANLAFMAQKVGASTPEIDYHSQQMALPASTQKVITALAALLQLGPDFRFTTTLETKGSLDGGVLKGDLIARFGGDPTLKRQDIRNMVATLKKAGVQRIEGNVLIDTSVFASHDKAPGWPWNDLTQCFSARRRRRLSTVTASLSRCIARRNRAMSPSFALHPIIRSPCSARCER